MRTTKALTAEEVAGLERSLASGDPVCRLERDGLVFPVTLTRAGRVIITSLLATIRADAERRARLRVALEQAHAMTTRQWTDEDGCVWPPVEWCRCCDKPWPCAALAAALGEEEGT